MAQTEHTDVEDGQETQFNEHAVQNNEFDDFRYPALHSMILVVSTQDLAPKGQVLHDRLVVSR